MYSPRITQRDLAAVELALGHPLTRYSVTDYRDQVDAIATAYDKDGELTRTLTKSELEFIDEQTLLCQFDFRYWAERNVFISLDDVIGGRIGLLSGWTRERPDYVPGIWASQDIILAHISHLEEEMWDDYDVQLAAGVEEALRRVKGICIVVHKARQLGATILAQSILLHRFIFWRNSRFVVASADETKTEEIFTTKTNVMLDNLPRWMMPEITSKAKIRGMRSDVLNNTILLQDAKQQSGIGMGGTSLGGHLTELGSWPKNIIDQLENHFFRSIPWSLSTIIILESLAQGQGDYWHRLVRDSIAGRRGRWHGVFIPWYAERGKYRKNPPPKWKPLPQTLKYAYRVYRASDQFVGEWVSGVWVGKQVTLDPAQLYYYEDEYRVAAESGMLADFLRNHPATPEEGFQSRSLAPFRPEVLMRLLEECKPPLKTYEWRDRGMRAADLSVNPDDVRGLIRVWEKPRSDARYMMGIDASRGIPNWDRRLPQAEDTKIDNMAVEIYRAGELGEPDVQVCEFLAPIDYVAGAPIANYLGRLFRGRDAEMCECIIETYPSPGEPLQEKLYNEFGYWNLYRKTNMATETHHRAFGWEATPRSVRDLWSRTKPHISFYKEITRDGKTYPRVKFVARSQYLVDVEFRNAEEDPDLMAAKAAYGFHDDATRASQLAIYGLHDWESYGEMPDDIISAVPMAARPDFQRTDVTREEIEQALNQKFDTLLGGASHEDGSKMRILW